MLSRKTNWPPYLAIENHAALQLPPRPGIKRQRCPICSLYHWGAICIQELEGPEKVSG